MVRELQSRGWSLEEALQRVTRSQTKEELASCCASGKLLAYAHDRSGAMAPVPFAEAAALLRGDTKRLPELQFYPILESPDVCAIIAGGLLKDIFKRYVLDDPEVLKLSVDAIRLQPDLARVLEGRWQAFGRYEWPVDQEILEEHDPDEGKESWVAKISLRGTPREIRQFRAVLRSRFNAMLELMRSGKYRALGDPARRGDSQEILSSIWSHPDYILDMWDGDLLQSNDGSDPNDLNSRYFKRWRAVTLVRAMQSIPSRVTVSRRQTAGHFLPESTAFTGWTLAGAIRRCIDRKTLTALSASRRSHHDGSRDLSEPLRELIGHLSAGRLVAWGRKDSPAEPPFLIPANTWPSIAITHCQKSVVCEHVGARSRRFDVRIFPLVESPDAVQRLAGKSFIEAFETFVVEDPELQARRQHSVSVGGQPARLGYLWQPYSAVWPVRHGMGWNGLRVVGRSQTLSQPRIHNATDAADRVLERRFSRLVSYLAEGLLIAEASRPEGGDIVEVPASYWRRARTYIDLENGDLLDCDGHADDHTTALSRPIFKGLMLREPQPSALKRSSDSPAAPSKPSIAPVAVKVVTKSSDRTACLRWLSLQMKESPLNRPRTKNEFWSEAKIKWPNHLSRRSFEMIWNEAIAATGASAWSASGRPRKSPRS